MNYPSAIVLSTAILCGTIVTVNNAVSETSPSKVQPPFSGQYQGIKAGDLSVYIVDSSTARVAVCYTTSNAGGSFTCGSFSAPPAP